MKEAVFAKHMSHFLLNTQYLSSKAHPYGSDNVFPLELLYFFSPHPNLSECGSWNLRAQDRERGREGERGERKGGRKRKRNAVNEGEVDLHVSTSTQTQRQVGREAWG